MIGVSDTTQDKKALLIISQSKLLGSLRLPESLVEIPGGPPVVPLPLQKG
jgi:hypothetical protein